MKNNYVSISLFFCLLLWSCSKTKHPDIPDSNGVITVTADANLQYQTIEGFGASDAWQCQMTGLYWPLEKREKIADLLFSRDTDLYGNPKGIGLSIWRFNIGAGSTEQGNSSFISDPWRRTECFLNEDGTYDWAKQQGQQWFLQAAKKRGVEKILGFTNSPPVFFTANQKAFSAGGYHLNLKSGALEKFSSFLATVARHFANEGIPIDYLSPVNEPQWNWTAGSDGWASQEGTPASNEDIFNLSKQLSQDLASRLLSTKVAVAEAGSIDYLYKTNDADRGNQIESFFKASSPDYIGNLQNVEKVISSHGYWTVWPVSDMISMRDALHSKINSVDGGVRYWQTEYCILEGANNDIGDGWGRDLTMQIALYVARLIHYDITKAYASSWNWWTALSRSDYKDGLIYLDDGTNNGIREASLPDYCKSDGYIRDSKLLWALGNYSFFIRPGMKRILISSPDILANQPYGLFISSYIDTDTKKIIAVIINYNNNQRTISFQLKNANFISGSLTGYVTSEISNLGKISNHLDPGKIVLLSNSITTLVAKYQ